MRRNIGKARPGSPLVIGSRTVFDDGVNMPKRVRFII